MRASFMIFDDFKGEKIEFGGRYLDIGLENVAVGVVELPPRCSNKGGKKRRCLQNEC